MLETKTIILWDGVTAVIHEASNQDHIDVRDLYERLMADGNAKLNGYRSDFAYAMQHTSVVGTEEITLVTLQSTDEELADAYKKFMKVSRRKIEQWVKAIEKLNSGAESEPDPNAVVSAQT